ncbi:hypothetical protein JYQ62_32810 [Nostoc sp. UHCC 0702]|nr:hypothetical protein JYQ62_32810 [Nostoc sp. UHCC 0702]
MEPNQPNITVGAFLQVVEQQDFVFDEKSRTNLAIINQTLAELENQPTSAAADAIAAWCKKHPDVRNAVVSLSNRDIKIKPRNPANQEGTLINQFPEYKKIIEEQQNNPSSEPNKK